MVNAAHLSAMERDFKWPHELSASTIAFLMSEEVDNTALLIMFVNNELHEYLGPFVSTKEIDALHLSIRRCLGG